MKFIRNIFYALPLPFRKFVRQIYFWPSDFLLKLSGKSKSEIPPNGKNFIGPGDFEKIGNEFFDYFKRYGQIQPDSKILELGCGMGRMALPFKSFLNSDGAFHGFDIATEGIEWCTNKIAPNDARFHFQKVDIYNKLYNPSGKINANEFVFPYPNNSFDFVFATSVFTHMLPTDLLQYIKETYRVLKPSKKALFTFFVMDEIAQNLVLQQQSFLDFKYHEKDFFTISKKIPESNVAFEKEWLNKVFAENNFKVLDEAFGSWSGRKPYLSFQDIVVLQKA